MCANCYVFMGIVHCHWHLFSFSFPYSITIHIYLHRFIEGLIIKLYIHMSIGYKA